MTESLHRLDLRTRKIGCQAGDCPKIARYRHEWRTPVMPAPAFNYRCVDHAPLNLLASTLRQNTP